MEPDDSDRYRNLDPNDRHDFLMKLAIDTLISQSAYELITTEKPRHTKPNRMRSIPPRPKDHAPELIIVISHTVATMLLFFNVCVDLGDN